MVSGHADPAAVTVLTIGGSTLAAVFVAMRMYARFRVAKNAGWDDGFIVGSVVFSVATTVTMVLQVRTGLGKHQWEIEKSESMTNLKAFWLSIIVYNFSLTCTKMSILLQYLRIFPQRKFKICVWVMIAVVIVYFFWRFFSAVFTCWPVDSFWDHRIKHKKCLNRLAVSFASAALNMATDIIITTMPLPILNKLELPRRQRRSLIAVFALGGIVCIISILRLPALYAVQSSKDISWHNPLGAIWSSLECNVAIITSCLPTLRCLFPKVFKATTYILSGSGNSYAKGFDQKPGGSHSTNGYHSSSYASTKGRFASTSTATGPGSVRFSQHQPQKSGGRWHIPTGRKDKSLEDLENAEEIELVDSPMAVPNDGQIHVHTDIEQVESTRGYSPVDSTRDLARYGRIFDPV